MINKNLINDGHHTKYYMCFNHFKILLPYFPPTYVYDLDMTK